MCDVKDSSHIQKAQLNVNHSIFLFGKEKHQQGINDKGATSNDTCQKMQAIVERWSNYEETGSHLMKDVTTVGLILTHILFYSME